MIPLKLLFDVVKLKLQREKRAYLMYMVYLLQSMAQEYLPNHFNSWEELEAEIRQVEAHIIAIDIKLQKTSITYQLN